MASLIRILVQDANRVANSQRHFRSIVARGAHVETLACRVHRGDGVCGAESSREFGSGVASISRGWNPRADDAKLRGMHLGDFDVAVVGSGIAGSALAIALRRAGCSTLVIERGRHPRFARSR